MLSADDKLRIEEEEKYRAEVRRRLGPIETTSFINRLVKFVLKAFIWWYVLALAVAAVVATILTFGPKKF